MLFADKIRQLREERKLLQCHLAAVLDKDTPMFSKIERGEQPAKHTQVIAIAKILTADENELLTLWLADKLLDVLEGEKELGAKVMIIVQQNIKE
ncbi:MAG: transcriptional regulator [Porphyromonadaceae bacterium CG2_30_38_12]|nr:MAG: transcriptional regulator [Porphyromonadaceae bacterium CG2_30_38_12]